MNEQNKKENTAEEIGRADEALKAAILLRENGFIADAVSKIYYFLLYNVRALLLTKGLEPKSHEGVLRLFSLHFVKLGPFKPDHAHLFSKLMKYREEADYNPSYTFTEDDLRGFEAAAIDMAEAIKEYLRRTGYLTP